jgi:hypothetical protein
MATKNYILSNSFINLSISFSMQPLDAKQTKLGVELSACEISLLMLARVRHLSGRDGR